MHDAETTEQKGKWCIWKEKGIGKGAVTGSHQGQERLENILVEEIRVAAQQ